MQNLAASHVTGQNGAVGRPVSFPTTTGNGNSDRTALIFVGGITEFGPSGRFGARRAVLGTEGYRLLTYGQGYETTA
jgi:hypothetical protein